MSLDLIPYLFSSFSVKESKEVVGGSTRQPATAHARMDPEAPLASGGGSRGYFANCDSSAPNTPG